MPETMIIDIVFVIGNRDIDEKDNGIQGQHDSIPCA